MDSGLPAGAIIVVFRIEEELLCKVQSYSRSVVLGGYVFCISTNNLYYCLKEDYYAQEIDLFNFFCFGAEHSWYC